MTRNGEVSFWWESLGRVPQRPALPGPLEADVAIVGAGYTGLWTAYYLKKLDPSLRVVVLEARFAGFGASGRNGGWLTNSVTGGVEQYVPGHGVEGARRQQQAHTDTVHEVVRVAEAEGINADIELGGEFLVARTAAQHARLGAALDEAEAWPEAGWVGLESDAARARIQVSNTRAALWQPHCARLHPAKLVQGLAAAVERLGVTIHEGTPVTTIEPGRARTPFGDVRATHVIRATEGFTARMPGQRRTWLPMNSSLVVTEPLPATFWDQIGWRGRETLGDFAHVYMYAQRTADDRIAFGGRGIPYRYGSRLDTDGATQSATIGSLTDLLTEFFPAAGTPAIAHAWSGVLGVPRDWSATVVHDPATGLGYAGGYVGTGVASSNLAGRTLAHLVLGRDGDLTSLPWVGHRTRRWEPEPLRWLGVQAIYGAFRAADRAEHTGLERTSRWARLASFISGH